MVMIWIIAIGVFLLTNILGMLRIIPVSVSPRFVLMLWEAMRNVITLKTWSKK